MSLFIALLAVCLVGGFLVTSLIWLLFWLLGVFEVPKGLRNLFGPRRAVRRFQGLRLGNVELEGQTAGTAWAHAFVRNEDPIPRLLHDGNSAPQPLLRTEISSDKNNSASSHALATS